MPDTDIMTHHSAVTERRSPYRVVGTSVAGTTDAHEALIKGGLDWIVSLDELTCAHISDDGVTTVPIPRNFAANRVNPDGTVRNIAVVGSDYHPRQNLETAGALQAIVDQTGAEFWSVGHTHNGARTFVQLGLPDNVSLIGGFDKVQWSIVALNNHDGHGKFRIVTTPTRIQCENQLSSLRRSEIQIAFRHSKGSGEQVDLDDLRRRLGLVVKEIENFESLGNHLIGQAFTDAEFDTFVDQLFRPRLGKDKLEVVSTITRREALSHLFRSAETQEGIRGTRWAAYNAVTEYVQWERTTLSPEKRALATVTGGADQLGQRALRLLTR